MGLIIDSFAGGGGASTGIRMAVRRDVDIAINHDPAAIAMHRANHTNTKHFCESVWAVDPREACGGKHVDLAWFSPDCKHFSKAKGAALVDRNIRGLAWIVLRWAGTVRPDVIILENVEEFITWGPVRKGKPIRSKSGETFLRWKRQLESLGYRVEHRELVACDYGAPTSRKRFYLIARCDGSPIIWPDPTHGRPDTLEVQAGLLKPWRTAAEIIDWTLPCPSVFATKQEIKEQYGVNAVRPLAGNTMRRIARGLDKFTIKSAEPFIVPIGYGERAGQDPRVQNVNAPVSTIVSSVKQYVCQPEVTPFSMTNTSNSVGTSADEPLNTMRTGGGCGQMVVAPSIIQYHNEQSEKVRGQSMDEPLMTVDATPRYGINAAFLSEWYGNAQDGLRVDEPFRTFTAKDREALTLAHIAEFKGQDKGQAANAPLRTLTATQGEFGIVKTRVEKYDGGDMKHWPEVRALLNEHCGYALADDEVLLIRIRGAWWFIADIGLRMLTPREAFNAQGFPPDYIIDTDDKGNPYPRSEQMARCGNAVCPAVAAALVRANYPGEIEQAA